MSHAKERAEKTCLNCNSELNGRYCHVCGQENIEPKDSAWGLVSHFFYDITHFDGKFFGTLKYLILKPGFVSLEYIKGRRARYLNPIRMYVFTSALFFVIFFSLYNLKHVNLVNLSNKEKNSEYLKYLKAEALKNAKTKKDSLEIEKQSGFFNHLPGIVNDSNRNNKADKPNVGFTVDERADSYHSVAEYDSAQKTLPPEKRDNWFRSLITSKFLDLKMRYRNDPDQLVRDILDKFIHSFPALLFVSLPLYALYLKLLYVRRRQYYYVDHGIFLIHLYIFTFIFLLLFFLLYKLKEIYKLRFITWIELIFILYGIYYAYKAMRNFYKQRRGKTILKFILFNILATITILGLFALFFSISILRT